MFPSLGNADSLWEELATPGHRRYQLLLDEARRQRDTRAFSTAENTLLEATRLLPADPAAWSALGELRLQLKRYAEARDPFERARRLAPDAADPLLAFHLGITRAVDGDFEGSLVEYRRSEAAGGPPELADRLAVNLGDSYMALGRLAEAITAYRRAVTLNSRLPYLRFALAVALDRDERLAESAAELALALRQEPDFRSLYPNSEFAFKPPEERLYYVALAHLSRSRFAAARADLRGFLAALPHGPYSARARDRLAAIPDRVHWDELSPGGGFEPATLAKALSPLVAEAERCLRPGDGELVEIKLTAHGPTANAPPLEVTCIERLTLPTRRLISSNGSATWQIARPASPPPLDTPR